MSPVILAIIWSQCLTNQIATPFSVVDVAGAVNAFLVRDPKLPRNIKPKIAAKTLETLSFPEDNSRQDPTSTNKDRFCNAISSVVLVHTSIQSD